MATLTQETIGADQALIVEQKIQNVRELWINKKFGWLRRLGLVGFLFFLCKGLLWLIMLAAAWWLS